jgi:hypothetical protein
LDRRRNTRPGWSSTLLQVHEPCVTPSSFSSTSLERALNKHPLKDSRSRQMLSRRERRAQAHAMAARGLFHNASPSPSPYDADSESIDFTDYLRNHAVTQPAMRPLGMNSYPAQPTRQGPRLQNANKTGLGASANQWGGFGMPSSGGAFGGLGGAPGLGQGRPGQLSGFAQVMGGGSGQGPIDMRYVIFTTVSKGALGYLPMFAT